MRAVATVVRERAINQDDVQGFVHIEVEGREQLLYTERPLVMSQEQPVVHTSTR